MKKLSIHSSNPSGISTLLKKLIPNSILSLSQSLNLNLNLKHRLNLLALPLLTLTALTALAPAANAQFMHTNPPIEAYASTGAGYNYEIEAVSIRLFVGFPATREFYSYSLDGGYYLHDLDGRANTVDMNFNLRFFIPGSDVFRPYVLTGANFTHFKDDFWGVNMGGGLQIAIGHVFLFARAQYTIGELDMLSINSGLSFLFSTSMH